MSVSSLNIFEFDFEKKKPEFVQGRDFHSLTFRKTGKISITDEYGKTYISEAPAVTYLPKGMHYSTEILESGQMIAVHFYSQEKFFGDEIKIFDISEFSVLLNLFSSLLAKQKPGISEKYAGLSVFYEILSILSESEQSKIPEKMLKARSYIDERFKDSSLSVSELARSLNISEVFLRREFKKYFSVSPLAYIMKVRINSAKAMLKTGYYTVSQVAEMCGFFSLSYFSYSFRKSTGTSPTQYAKRFLK